MVFLYVSNNFPNVSNNDHFIIICKLCHTEQQQYKVLF